MFSPSSHDMDEYLKPLSPNQMNELQKLSDNWVALMLSCGPTGLHSGMPDQIPLPSAHLSRPVNQIDLPQVDTAAAVLMYNSQQSSPHIGDGIHYDENLLPHYNLESTQVTPYLGVNQAAPALEFDLLLTPLSSSSSPSSAKKSIKKKQNQTLSRSIRSSRSLNINDWLIMDENGKKRRPLLHEFLRQLLDSEDYSHIAEYVDKKKGIFKFHQRNAAANLWQDVKGRNSDSQMTYDKLARAIRYYYSSGVIRQNPGRFTFRFGSASGFGIILAFTKRNPIEIAEALKRFNLDLISTELVQHLIQYIPNDMEIAAFRHLSIDKEQLSPADRLMYEIIQLPFYMERLYILKFKLTTADNCHSLNEQMQLINEAYNFLYQSAHISKLLEIILSVLNHLNSTPKHRILTLDDLSKICDLKTSKTRIPVMNIVSQICIDRHSEIFDLKENYKLILSASKIDLNVIKSDIEQMKQQSEQIQLWINKFEEKHEIQKFLNDSNEKLNEISRYYRTINDQLHKTISYFTKQTTTSTNFLSIFANLIHSLQKKL